MEFGNAVDQLHIALQDVFSKKAKAIPQKGPWASSATIPW